MVLLVARNLSLCYNEKVLLGKLLGELHLRFIGVEYIVFDYCVCQNS